MQNIKESVFQVLNKYMSPIICSSVMNVSQKLSNANMESLSPEKKPVLFRQLSKGVKLYVSESDKQKECISALSEILSNNNNNNNNRMSSPPRESLLLMETIPINKESDVVAARIKGRTLCRELGFPVTIQVMVSTAISELARNILQYAVSGEISLRILKRLRRGIEIIARDKGPGITNVDEILSGQYRSKTGMGKGLIGTKKIMDEFEVLVLPESGTKVIARKYLD